MAGAFACHTQRMKSDFIINNYWYIILLIFMTNCEKTHSPPVAVAEVFPLIADSTITIEFNSNSSLSKTTYLQGLVFSWDFEGDGYWNVDDSKESTSLFKYSTSGIYYPVLKVTDHYGLVDYDTVTVWIKPQNTFIDSLIDIRDGQIYKTVLLGNQWWMAENLDYGLTISTDSEQLDNGVVEKYYYEDNQTLYSQLGGVYEWKEAINYGRSKQGICPDGWHIPTSQEWITLMEEIDQWYAWQYYSTEGISQLNIDVGVSARRENDTLSWNPGVCDHWARDYKQLDYLREKAPYSFRYKSNWGAIGLIYIQTLYDESDGIYLEASNYGSVRCIKDL